MKISALGRAAFAAGARFVSLATRAALVDMGDYVWDDEAGTDYLKLELTEFYTYNDIVINDRLGYIAEGWSVASQTALAVLASGPQSSVAFALICDIFDIGNVAIITNADAIPGGHPFPDLLGDSWDSTAGYMINDPSRFSSIYTAADNNDFPVTTILARAHVVPLPKAGYLFTPSLAGLITRKRLAS